jgi:hypothetical protein
MRRTLVLLVSLLVLAPAAPAAAAWFPADVVDGPGPIDAVGGVSLARDATGAVAYIKREGDNPAGYLARFVDGGWRPAERLAGADGLSDIAVVADDGGRLAVVWVSNGNVFGTAAPRGSGAAFAAPVALSSAGGAGGLDIQVGVQGGVFAVWSQAGGGGSDVRAAMLNGPTWSPIAAPLDIDSSRSAGAGTGRPRVSVAADDTAVVTWGEVDAGGVSHVYYRRLLGTDLSQYPQEASVASLGAEVGGNADTPQIDVEYDRNFAWVTFRQDVGGRSRTLARRLRGSTFDPPVAADGGVTSTSPFLAMNPIGEGLMGGAAADNTVIATHFVDKDVRPSARVDDSGSTANPEPVAYTSDRADAAIVYRSQGGDGSAVVRARFISGSLAAGVEAVVSRPDAGPVAPGSLRAGGDRVGDVAVAMIQSPPTPAGGRVLTVALHDIPPSRPVVSARSRYVNPRTEGITWSRGLDYLGPQTFRVRVDGREIGTATVTRLRTRALRDGRHRLQVIGIDRRGQQNASRVATMFVDTRRPRASVSATRAGRRVTVSVRASDPGARGSGVRTYVVDWGDGRRTTSTRSTLRHRYSSSARRKITVTVRDRARNETVKTLRR